MMKTRVNLFTQEFKPKKEKLNLLHASSIFGVVFVLMLGLIVSAHYDEQQLISELDKQNNVLEQLESENNELNAQLEQHIENPVLRQQLAGINNKLRYQQDILSVLGQLSAVQNSSFSVLMDDLARLRDDDLRLQTIRLSADTMTLEGIAREHEAIPRWVAQFEQGSSLKNREFTSLNIGRNAEDIITFKLTNTAQGGE